METNPLLFSDKGIYTLRSVYWMGKEFISLKEFLDKEQEVLLIAFALYEHIYLDCCE